MTTFRIRCLPNPYCVYRGIMLFQQIRRKYRLTYSDVHFHNLT